MRNILAKPLFCNIYISFSPQDGEAVLRMAEEYVKPLHCKSISFLWIAYPPPLYNLSLYPQVKEIVLRMTEEYVS
jgi:hypothetical protein